MKASAEGGLVTSTPGDVSTEDAAQRPVGAAPEGADDAEQEILLLAEQSLAHQLPIWEPTSDAEVDAALDCMTSLSNAPLSDHAAVFDEVYRRLHGRLSGLCSTTT